MRHLLPLVLAFASSAFAQTDITSRYLLNPSFEQDDISSLPRDNTRGAYTAATLVGWQLTGNYGVSDIMTVRLKCFLLAAMRFFASWSRASGLVVQI